MSDLIECEGRMGIWGWRLFVKAIIAEHGSVTIRDFTHNVEHMKASGHWDFNEFDYDFKEAEPAVKLIMNLGQNNIRVMGEGSIYWDKYALEDEYYEKYTPLQ